MLEKTKNFDLFGNPFSFHPTKGSRYYQTPEGGIITLIGTSFFIFLSVWSLSKVRVTTDPVISQNKLWVKRSALLNLMSHETLNTFIFADDDKFFRNSTTIDRYFTIKRRIIKTKTDSRGSVIEEKSEEVPVRKCWEARKRIADKVIDFTIRHPETAELFMLHKIMDAALCGAEDPSKAVLGFNGQNGFSTRIETEVYPCSLPDPRGCATPFELSRVIFGAGYFGKLGNFTNKMEPFILAFRSFGTQLFINQASKVRYTQYFQEKFVYDDSRDFFGKTLRGSGIEIAREWLTSGTRASRSIHCTAKMVEERSCEPYLIHIAKSGRQRIEVYREYRKLFASFSEIGGYVDLIIYSLWAFYYFYNKNKYLKYVRSQLIENFLDLKNEKNEKGSLARESRKEDIKQLSLYVDSQSKTKAENNDQNRMVGLLFDSCFNYENLLELNFKSAILLESIIEKPEFGVLARSVIMRRRLKRRRRKIQIKSIGGEKDDEESKVSSLFYQSSSRLKFLEKLREKNSEGSERTRSRLQGFLSRSRTPQRIVAKKMRFVPSHSQRQRVSLAKNPSKNHKYSKNLKNQKEPSKITTINNSNSITNNSKSIFFRRQESLEKQKRLPIELEKDHPLE